MQHCLGGRFGYFLFFLLRGEEGGVRGEREGGGSAFSLKIPGGGGVPGEGGRGRGGREGVCREFGGICWWGGKYFFSGPKCPPSCGSGVQCLTKSYVGGAEWGGSHAKGRKVASTRPSSDSRKSSGSSERVSEDQ